MVRNAKWAYSRKFLVSPRWNIQNVLSSSVCSFSSDPFIPHASPRMWVENRYKIHLSEDSEWRGELGLSELNSAPGRSIVASNATGCEYHTEPGRKHIPRANSILLYFGVSRDRNKPGQFARCVYFIEKWHSLWTSARLRYIQVRCKE